jgi:hypothetical protein
MQIIKGVKKLTGHAAGSEGSFYEYLNKLWNRIMPRKEEVSVDA